MFPHIPRELIIEDLQRTNSVEQTAENILDGELVAAPPMYAMEEVEDLPPATSPSSTHSPSLVTQQRLEKSSR
jgi:hypothetical protein